MRFLKAHIYDADPKFALCGAKMDRAGTPPRMRLSIRRQRARIYLVLKWKLVPPYLCGSCTRAFKRREFDRKGRENAKRENAKDRRAQAQA